MNVRFNRFPIFQTFWTFCLGGGRSELNIFDAARDENFIKIAIPFQWNNSLLQEIFRLIFPNPMSKSSSNPKNFLRTLRRYSSSNTQSAIGQTICKESVLRWHWVTGWRCQCTCAVISVRCGRRARVNAPGMTENSRSYTLTSWRTVCRVSWWLDGQ